MQKALLPLVGLLVSCFFPAVMALDAPTVSCINYPNQSAWYMPAAAMHFSWGAVDGATNYYYSMDKEPSTDPDPSNELTESTTETEASYKKGVDGAWYFHVRAANGSTLGPSSHFKVLLDGTRPDWVDNAPLQAAPLEDGNLQISWSSATDSMSGVDYYELYRGSLFDFDLKNATHKYSPVRETTYMDTNGMEEGEGKTFFYLVVAVDNAGNQSRISNKASAKTLAFCDVSPEISVSLSDDKRKILVGLNADGNLYSATFAATFPDGETQTFFNHQTLSSFETELDVNAVAQGIITFDLDARERLGDDCSQKKQFVFDVTSPGIEIVSPEMSETVEEVVNVVAEASDNGSYQSGIASVELFVVVDVGKWDSVGKMAAVEEGRYSLDWNTFAINNGSYQLKAVVTDAVGNSAEHVSRAIVLNTLYQEGDANVAIAAALEAREGALAFIDSLKKKNVVSAAFDGILAMADGNLSLAKELFEKGGNEFTNSKLAAEKAKAVFDSVEGRLAVEKGSEREFIYNAEQVKILLGASPLDKSLVEEASQLIAAASSQRKLEIFKVSADDNSFFRARVLVSFSFSSEYLAENDLNGLKLVEFVPKEFVEDASGITSYYGFEVLEADPKIEFAIDDNILRQGWVSYGLDRDLTEQEANALIEGNIINKFAVPPILLKSGTALSPTGFFLPFGDIFGGIPMDLVLIALGLVVAVVIAIVVVLVVVKKKKKKKKPDLSIFE